MLICRKNQSPVERALGEGTGRSTGRYSPRRAPTGQGGPVFLPPRKPSPLARALIASIAGVDNRVTAYDGSGSTSRPGR